MSDESRHVHHIPSLRLPAVERVQVCMPPSPELGRQIRQFAHVWGQTLAILKRKGLTKLAQGVSIVLTERRGYYARFWRGHILVVNLKDFLAKGKEGPGILLHELGHRVWFHTMRQQTRARWAADHHVRLKNSMSASFVSSYAKRNALEDHAEAFRARMEGQLSGDARARYERLGPTTRIIRGRRLAA